MAEGRVQRRLAAILAADVVGYSRLMEDDEAGTLSALKARRKELVEPLMAEHHGRIFKFTGDGLLAEFSSAVDAVECAINLQHGMDAANGDLPGNRQIALRIGVNLGDVMVEGRDLYGDGVNIAARLESLAEPGGILLSGTTYDHARNKVKARFDDLGIQTVKNIAEPVRVYRVVETSAALAGISKKEGDKPSIAVLPFENLSGDPNQDYFADGITEDIIIELSRFRSLVVIARNSSFYYKGRSVNVKQVGRELGVHYILEGSVRRASDRIRIAGHLIDVSTGTHLWADRFEGEAQDIFDLQDQVIAKVVGAIAPKLEEAEIERVRREPTQSQDAYDYFLRGMAGLHKWSREGSDEALANFYRAFELDPNYAAAHGLAARTYVQRNAGGWVTDPLQEMAEANRLARRAVDLGHDDAVALCTAGFALADFVGDIEDGYAFIQKALGLNPHLAWAWLYSGWVKASTGDADCAIELIARAKQLSPHDPQDFSIQTAMAFTHFIAGRYDEALECAQSAIRDRPRYLLASCIAAVSAALAGRAVEAGNAINRVRDLSPSLRIANCDAVQMIRRPEDIARWKDGFRKAGLPE